MGWMGLCFWNYEIIELYHNRLMKYGTSQFIKSGAGLSPTKEISLI